MRFIHHPVSEEGPPHGSVPAPVYSPLFSADPFGQALVPSMSPRQVRQVTDRLHEETRFIAAVTQRAEAERRAVEAVTELAIERENSQTRYSIQAAEARLANERRLLEITRQQEAIRAERDRQDGAARISELAKLLGIPPHRLSSAIDEAQQRAEREKGSLIETPLFDADEFESWRE